MRNFTLDNLVESYKTSLCKCLLKGEGKASFVNRRNAIPYFKSKPKSIKTSIANFFFSNNKIIDLLFYTILLLRAQNPVLRWFIAITISHSKIIYS